MFQNRKTFCFSGLKIIMIPNWIIRAERLLQRSRDKEFHGYGLKGIRYTVNKYDGAVSIDTKENWFDLKILIPVGENAQKQIDKIV